MKPQTATLADLHTVLPAIETQLTVLMRTPEAMAAMWRLYKLATGDDDLREVIETNSETVEIYAGKPSE